MAKKTVKLSELNAKANELLELAEQSGVEQNYFFLSTFERYQTQIDILYNLKKTIKKTLKESKDVMVTKTYGNKSNIAVHPAIKEYNSTATAANQTAQTLLKIISTFAEHSITEDIEDDDEL